MSDTELSNACRALWPFIRHFPLCGADPDATAAVMRIGELIGMTTPGGGEQIATAETAKVEAREEMMAFMRDFVEDSRKIMRKDKAVVIQAVQHWVDSQNAS